LFFTEIQVVEPIGKPRLAEGFACIFMQLYRVIFWNLKLRVANTSIRVAFKFKLTLRQISGELNLLIL